MLIAISTVGVGASTAGTALAAGLVVGSPMLLFALNPSTAITLLVAHRISFAAFLGIGVVRLLATMIAPFQVGRLYGRQGLERVVSSERGRRRIDQLRGGARPFVIVSLLVSSTTVVAAIAGLTHVRPMPFVAIGAVGATARLVLLWWVAGLFADQLDAVHELISRWQWPLLVAGCLVTALIVGVRHRRRASR